MKSCAILIFLLLFLTFCAALPARASAALHRIGVRVGAGGGEFYDTVTNARFTPRGNNYIRLALQHDPFGGDYVYHSTFNVGLYNATQVNDALTQMHHDGYNVVRVFINELAVGNSGGSGLSTAYLQNVVDFMQKAEAAQVYVILTLSVIPKSGNYYPPSPGPNFESDNVFYLTSAFIDAKKNYVTDFVSGLVSQNAPMSVVFGYHIENEVSYVEDQKPLSLSSGMIATANGATYDMSNPTDKQQMMDANLVNWINSVRAAILQIDSAALVAPGFFSPLAVQGPADPRVIRTYWAIADSSSGGSSADYIDLHAYPGLFDTSQEMASFEIGSHQKPLLLGEFGAFKTVYTNTTSAAYALRDYQVLTCTRYGFVGWLLWTWDTAEQPELWNALDNAGAINGILAPLNRLNPCSSDSNKRLYLPLVNR